MQTTRPSALRLGAPNDFLKPKRDLKIEGLRGLCALLVVYGHLSASTPVLDPNYALNALFINFGPPSVLIFFVLSGYVIGLTVRTPPTLSSAWRYLQRRAVRIIPIAWVAIILSSLIKAHPALVIVGNCLFLQNSLPYPFGARFPLLSNNLPLWSLSYEMLYYVLFLAVWRFSPRLLILYCIIVLLVLGQPIGIPAIIASQAAGFMFWISGLTIAWLTRSETVAEDSHWLAAVIGALAFWTIGPLRALTLVFLHRYATASMVSLGNLDFCLAATLVVLAISNRAPRAQSILALVGLLLCLAVIPFKIFEVMVTDGDLWAMGFLALALGLWKWKRKVPSLAGIAPIGAMSYALYAIHVPIAEAIRDKFVFLPTGSPWSYLLRLFVFVVIAFPLAWFLECCLQPWIKEILNRPVLSVNRGAEAISPNGS